MPWRCATSCATTPGAPTRRYGTYPAAAWTTWWCGHQGPGTGRDLVASHRRPFQRRPVLTVTGRGPGHRRTVGGGPYVTRASSPGRQPAGRPSIPGVLALTGSRPEPFCLAHCRASRTSGALATDPQRWAFPAPLRGGAPAPSWCNCEVAVGLEPTSPVPIGSGVLPSDDATSCAPGGAGVPPGGAGVRWGSPSRVRLPGFATRPRPACGAPSACRGRTGAQPGNPTRGGAVVRRRSRSPARRWCQPGPDLAFHRHTREV